ncbi:MAG: cobalamin-dependent protein [Anaerolineae bacterium]
MTQETKIIEALRQKVIEGEIDEVPILAQQALDEGLDSLKAINEGLIRGIIEVGRLYETGEYYLPELMMSAEALKGGLDILEREVSAAGIKRETAGTVVIGTVQGDIHDIGKSIVATMMNASGLSVHDLGVDVSSEAFIAKVKEVEADILAMSALLPITMPYMEKVIQETQTQGLRAKIKVMVGGAPVTPAFAEKIGADGYADDAAGAARLAMQWMG